MTERQILYGTAERGDLEAILALYRHLHLHDPELDRDEKTLGIWRELMDDPKIHLLAARAGNAVIATCTLIIVPNLTRGSRPYALIENVVTDPDHRGRGVGTALLRHAQSLAWERGCYKVMLMTGRKTPEIVRFYEGAGFLSGDKLAFVARPPYGGQ
jgi:GNAT superfamily N-acetyltransferase